MRVERLRSEFDINIEFKHYPLHPNTPDEGLTLEQLFAGRNIDIPASKARMAGLMADEGLPFGERTMTYNSRLAQELATWAQSNPRGEQIHDALFQAYFVNNVNLAKIDNLVAIAQEVGLSPSDARESLEERRCRNAVDADWQRSRELGITGVPTFVIGKRGIVGAQPFEQLVEFVTSAGAGRRGG